MGVLTMISNRHLLLGLVGLGVLNAVLCLMYMMREKSNATEIAKLTDDLKLASDKHHSREQFLVEELLKTRDDLTQTRRSLSQTAEKLEGTQADLERVRTTLATYQNKPWLAESGKAAPWAESLGNLFTRLGRVEKTLRDNKLVPAESREK